MDYVGELIVSHGVITETPIQVVISSKRVFRKCYLRSK